MPAQASAKVVAAGLIGTAALALPGTTAWASPSSIALTSAGHGSTAFTATQLLGPGTQFRAYSVGRPTLVIAPGGTGTHHAAKSRTSKPHASDLPGNQTPGSKAATTAKLQGLPTQRLTSRQLRQLHHIETLPQQTQSPVTTSGAQLPRVQVPDTSSSATSSSSRTQAATASTGPTSVTLTSFVTATPPSSDGTTGTAVPAGGTTTDAGGQWGDGQITNAGTTTVNPGGTNAPQQQSAQNWQQNLASRHDRHHDHGRQGDDGQTQPPQSQTTTTTGTTQPGEGTATPPVPATTTPSVVTPPAPAGGVDPVTVATPATGAMSTATGAQTGTVTGTTTGTVTGTTTGTAVGTATTTAPATGTATGATTGTATTATATTPTVTSVAVSDPHGNPAGTLVLNQATGAAQVLNPAGAVVGSVVIDQATGIPSVIGPTGTVLGSLTVNETVTFVPATTGTSTGTATATPPTPGTDTVAAGSTAGTAAVTGAAGSSAGGAALAANGVSAGSTAGGQTASLTAFMVPSTPNAGSASSSVNEAALAVNGVSRAPSTAVQTATLTAFMASGTPAAPGADPNAGIVPGTLTPPLPVSPAPAPKTGLPTVSGGGVFTIDSDGKLSFNPMLFLTPPQTIDGISTGGNVPLSFQSIPNLLNPSPAPAPRLSTTPDPQNFLDPAPQIDPVASDPLIKGLTNTIIQNQAAADSQAAADAVSQSLKVIESFTPGSALSPTPSPTPGPGSSNDIFPSATQTASDALPPASSLQGMTQVASLDPNFAPSTGTPVAGQNAAAASGTNDLAGALQLAQNSPNENLPKFTLTYPDGSTQQFTNGPSGDPLKPFQLDNNNQLFIPPGTVLTTPGLPLFTFTEPGPYNIGPTDNGPANIPVQVLPMDQIPMSSNAPASPGTQVASLDPNFAPSGTLRDGSGFVASPGALMPVPPDPSGSGTLSDASSPQFQTPPSGNLSPLDNNSQLFAPPAPGSLVSPGFVPMPGPFYQVPSPGFSQPPAPDPIPQRTPFTIPASAPAPDPTAVPVAVSDRTAVPAPAPVTYNPSTFTGGSFGGGSGS